MSPTHTVSVPGKIILAGEYAVVFGYPGLATPSKERMTVHFTTGKKMEIVWPEVVGTPWIPYAEKIVSLIREKVSVQGTYTIENELPLGKGMGSSTALVIACCRVAIGNGSDKFAREIEDEVNKGHSGIDFAVIARASPILFVKGKLPEPVELPEELTDAFEIIDTGTPNEPTTELVAWVKSRYSPPPLSPPPSRGRGRGWGLLFNKLATVPNESYKEKT